MVNHAAKYVDWLMRAVQSREIVHTISTFLLIVIRLECMVYFSSCKTCGKIYVTVVPVMLRDRGVCQVSNYTHTFFE